MTTTHDRRRPYRRTQLPPMKNGRVKSKARKLAKRYHDEGRPLTEILYRVRIEFRFRDTRVQLLAQETAAEFLRGEGKAIR